MNLWVADMTAKYNQYTTYGKRWKYIKMTVFAFNEDYWNTNGYTTKCCVPYN